MIIKNAKTILFAGLIAAMILPFSGMQFAEAQESIGKIPTDKIIERTAEIWSSKYNTTEEFQAKTAYVKEYTEASLPENGMNQFIQRETIRLHNFETIIGEKIDAGELVALYAAKQKADNTYGEPYHAVQKYHDWLLSQYDLPTKTIDSRILEIIGDTKYLEMSQEFVDSKNSLAFHGVIPFELFETDKQYWGKVTLGGECHLDETCDFEDFQKVFDYPVMTEEERALYKQGKPQPVSTGIVEFFLPNIYAWTLQHYQITYGTVYVEPADTCAPGNCRISDSLTGMSPQSGSDIFTGDHGIGTHLDTYVSHCGGDSTVVNENSLTATVGSDYNDDAVGWGCATTGNFFQVAQSEQATWLYSVSADAESSKWVP